MLNQIKRIYLVGGAVCLVACSNHSEFDAGEVCLKATDSGESVEVYTIGSGAPRGSCIKNVEQTCEATVDGSVITVSNETHWQRKPGNCVVNAIHLIPTPLLCDEIGPLDPGTYTLVYGDEVTEVELPVDTCEDMEG